MVDLAGYLDLASCGSLVSRARAPRACPAPKSGRALLFIVSSASSAKSGNTGLKTDVIPDSGTRQGSPSPRRHAKRVSPRSALAPCRPRTGRRSARHYIVSIVLPRQRLDVTDSKIALWHALRVDPDQLLVASIPAPARTTIRCQAREAPSPQPQSSTPTSAPISARSSTMPRRPLPPALRTATTTPTRPPVSSGPTSWDATSGLASPRPPRGRLVETSPYASRARSRRSAATSRARGERRPQAVRSDHNPSSAANGPGSAPTRAVTSASPVRKHDHVTRLDVRGGVLEQTESSPVMSSRRSRHAA